MFWVQIKNKSPVFPAWEFQPHSSTGGEHQGLDKKEFLNDLSELSWGDWHYCELWTQLQRVFYRCTPEGRSLDGSFNACPHMQSRWNSLSDGARILLPLKVLPLNSVGADLFVLDAYTASLISAPQYNNPSFFWGRGILFSPLCTQSTARPGDVVVCHTQTRARKGT